MRTPTRQEAARLGELLEAERAAHREYVDATLEYERKLREWHRAEAALEDYRTDLMTDRAPVGSGAH